MSDNKRDKATNGRLVLNRGIRKTIATVILKVAVNGDRYLAQEQDT